ncbi:MAG: tRNA preQ1(34) S-adenosylmethionine ribosyltransferase-isomerase QueA [Myxococcales bacterium]|nr:tRNA preQ1(34) S-adenosylmethionine ribosyltransferase-isomerase QueA [Myxococcales bacterium]
MRRTSDYDFDLPSASIAQSPAERRDASRLLHLEPGGAVVDRQFAEFVDLLPEDAVLLVNDTKVIRARLRTQKESGGAVELLLLEPTAEARRWRCLAKASKPIRDGCPLLVVGTEIQCKAIGGRSGDGSIIVEFSCEVFSLLEEHGELPLPPYIRRQAGDTASDRERYQTVFAREQGAVAAPTAGLHFSDEILEAIDARGITRTNITLHVGLGTFAPVRATSLEDIELHEERYNISPACAELVQSGRPVIAVGTTVVRALESAATGHKSIRSGAGRTSIFISPGYQFQIVDQLLTNFHLPKSTLLMLVSAFAGHARVMEAYAHAVASGYRFYSYGDVMLVSPSFPSLTKEDE